MLMKQSWRDGSEQDEWDEPPPQGQNPPPAEPPRCHCGRELIIGFRGIRGASPAINTYFECDLHGEVIPVEPEADELGPGRRWGDGFEDVRTWRAATPQPTGRARPPAMSERYAVGAVRAKPASKSRHQAPMDPRSFG
jgi:hypothetical protein